jgi:hypothetical protein
VQSSEIVSFPSALRYLRTGDSSAKRARLACILACMYLLPAGMALIVLILVIGVR